MDNQNLKQLAGVIILSLVVSAGVAWTKPSTTVVKEVQVPVPKEKPLGIAGPDIISPYISFGGVKQWAVHADVNTASSTVCALQSPAATSSLKALVVNFTNGTGTTFPLEIGWSAVNPTATSTLLYQLSMTGSLSRAISATSTLLSDFNFGAVAAEDTIVQPNTYFVVNVGTTSHPGSAGSCNALFVAGN